MQIKGASLQRVFGGGNDVLYIVQLRVVPVSSFVNLQL